MVDDGGFGPWGQVILAGIGATGFLLILLVFACFLTPGCLGYECIRIRRKVSDKSIPLRFKRPAKESLKPNDISYRSWRLGSLYDNTNGTICENTESQFEPRNSITAQMDVIDTSSTMNLIKSEKKKMDNKLKNFPTELTMSLRYIPPTDAIVGKLLIGIEALSGLPPKQYNCTLEPYVVLNIMKMSWPNRKKQKLHTFKTKGVRHTASPIYRETFIVDDAKPQEIKEWILDLAAFDLDRFANHTELATLQIMMKDMKDVFINPKMQMYNIPMKPSNKEFGKILLGVSYLPTAQRLTINVIKLRDIKLASTAQSVEQFYPFVKIYMLNGKSGKKLKKRKTKIQPGSLQPEFNETLIFDLPANQIDSLQFLVVLCSKTSMDETIQIYESDSEGSVTSYKKSQDNYLGKVALGKGVRGPTERLHWFSVLQNPRHPVIVWHTLK